MIKLMLFELNAQSTKREANDVIFVFQ